MGIGNSDIYSMLNFDWSKQYAEKYLPEEQRCLLLSTHCMTYSVVV